MGWWVWWHARWLALSTSHSASITPDVRPNHGVVNRPKNTPLTINPRRPSKGTQEAKSPVGNLLQKFAIKHGEKLDNSPGMDPQHAISKYHLHLLTQVCLANIDRSATHRGAGGARNHRPTGPTNDQPSQELHTPLNKIHI